MILVNVLVTLALGAALVTLMFTSQEALVDRTRRAATATQAEALVLGAEASVRAALLRDMQTAPEADHFAEPWALAAQQEVRLETGSFSIEIIDLRGRFDLNSLAGNGLAQAQIFTRLAGLAGLSNVAAETVMGHLSRRGAVSSLHQVPGLDAEAIALLAPHVSLLSTRGGLNINSAEPTALAAVVGSNEGAARLIKLRERKGFLTRGDLTDAGVVLLGGVAFKSDAFEVISKAEVDGTEVTLSSRLERRSGPAGHRVHVTARRFGALRKNGGAPDSVTERP